VSDITTTTTVPGARAGLPWGQWWSQLRAIVRLELRKGFRRSFGLLLLAFSPLVILIPRILFPRALGDPSDVAKATEIFAWLYQVYILRVMIFLACIAIFGNLIRREMLDRSLHYYFLSPVRRELLVVAKYVTGLIVSCGLFGLTTALSFVLTYLPHDSARVQHFLFQEHGLGHLASYLLVTLLACVGYGAVFLFFGFFFKSPAMPALAVFGWEGIHFLLPPLLKQVSVIHYLQSLCPVKISEGPIAILSDAPAPWVSVVGLSALALVLVAVSAWKIRRMEITYDEA
jgi:ABC-type transport system involved in multi-copper enzyme maturation permease subunit